MTMSPPPERDATADATPSMLAAGTTLRCPHCRNPVRLADERSDEVHCPACGSTFHVRDSRLTDTAAPMTRLGRFQLLERVGQGAFGAVWKARDTELDRVVALKIPHAGLLDSDGGAERFSREARAAAQLRHAGIVTVHEVASLDGRPAIVADFITGLTLRDLVKVRPLTFREAADLVAQVADALDYSHAQGLVHRDVKPTNIMVEPPVAGETGPGRPLLMDFGLALRDEAETTMTLDGQVVGTPAYMAPEQAAGKGHHADRRSDVYGLGVVLYELLTGELPFRGSRAMILHQVLREEPQPPRRLNHHIPRDLETVCLKAMEKEPAKRYATAAAFAADLRRFLDGEPVAARPVGRLERGWRWCRRNPWVAGLATALFAALVAGAGVSAALAVKAHRAAVAAAVNEGIANEKAGEAQAEAFLARRRVHNARMLLAAQAWEAGDVGRVMVLLDGQTPERTGGTDLRGFEWHYLRGLMHQELRSFPGHSGTITGVAFGPDGRLVATGASEGPVRIWEAATGREVCRLPGTSPSSLAFTPDGERLVALGSGPDLQIWVWVWDVRSGTEVRRVGPVPRGFSPPFGGYFVGRTVSPDGRFAAYVTREAPAAGRPPGETLTVLDVATGRTVATLRGGGAKPGEASGRPPGQTARLAFSPDGRLLAAAGDTVFVWDVAAGTEAADWPIRIDPVTARGAFLWVAFSSDGRSLAAAGDGTVCVWTLVADRAPQLTRWAVRAARGFATNADGSRLATGADDGSVTVWVTKTGAAETTFRGHAGAVNNLAFSPDGGRLLTGAFRDETARLWDFKYRPPTRHSMLSSANQMGFGPMGRGAARVDAAFTADGRTLVATNAGAINAWDVGTRQATAPPVWSGARAVAAHPRDPLLAIAWAGGGESVLLWDAVRGAEVRRLGTGPFSSVAFSPDGQYLAAMTVHSSGRGPVRIWEVPGGREAATVPVALPSGGPTVVSVTDRVALGPAGRSLAVVRSGTVQVWDVAAGAVRWSAGGAAENRRFFAVAVSPDGRWVAAGGGVSLDGPDRKVQHGQTLEVWEAESGRSLWRRDGPGQGIRDVAFGPADRLFVGGGDGTVWVWDRVTGEEVLPLRGRSSTGIESLAVSPDGRLLAATLSTSAVAVWDARPVTEEVRAEREAAVTARRVAGRNLLPDEMAAAIRDDPALTEPARRIALAWAARAREDPRRLNETAWSFAAAPGRPAAEYERAVRLAEAAVREAPDDAAVLNTLGVAQYRAGRYADAARTLEQSATLSKGNPTDLAFLAMVQHRLGQPEPARATLARLREAMTAPNAAADAEAKRSLAEAEALIDPPAAPKEPPRP